MFKINKVSIQPSNGLEHEQSEVRSGDSTLCTCAAMSSFWMMMRSLSKLLLFSRKVCGLHSLLPRLFKYSFCDRQEETLVTDGQMSVSLSFTLTRAR